jgi:dTDP-4-amino-4,6-dideoxygalactose transaminase
MTRGVDELAMLGGRPLFERPVVVGQRHFPEWERYAEAMRGICEREWYTNHGPLAAQAERELAAFLGVEYVVCVSSATVGLMMAVKALGLDGAVIVPALAAPAEGEALILAGTRPRFCDAAPGEVHMSPDGVRGRLKDDVQAILAVNLWGDVCAAADLETVARAAGIPLLLDSSHAFGCTRGGHRVGGSGALEVFSFHQSNVLNAAEGGCVATNDEELAARMRNIRSSYGAGRPVKVPITSNGRFSEAQAALTLMGLEDIDAHIDRNRAQFDAYADGIRQIPGLRLLTPGPEVLSNFQSAVVEVDATTYGISRDDLLAVLQAENVQAIRPIPAGLHRLAALGDGSVVAPEADRVSAATVQLPLGAPLEIADVEAIVTRLRAVQTAADELTVSQS